MVLLGPNQTTPPIGNNRGRNTINPHLFSVCLLYLLLLYTPMPIQLTEQFNCVTSPIILGNSLAYGNNLPGFKILFGSKVNFTARIKFIVTSSISREIKGRFAIPTPCSPESVPCSESTKLNTSSKHA